MKKSIKYILALFLLIPSLCFGSSFSISPIELNLKNNRDIQEIRITNNNSYNSIIQLDAYKWKQELSKDIVDKTKDLIVSPKIISIMPKSTQVVRVAVRKKYSGELENSYRLRVAEVLDPKIDTNVALAFNIPVFVLPENIDKKFNAIIKNNNNKYTLNLSNPGNIRRHVSKIQLINSKTKKTILDLKSFTYVHAKQEKHLDLDNMLDKKLFENNDVSLKINLDGKVTEIPIPIT